MAERKRPGRPRKVAAAEQGDGARHDGAQESLTDIFEGYDWYQASRYRFPRQLSSVSIQKNGQLSVSEDLAVYLVKEDGRGAVVIGYNVPMRRIAIRPVELDTPGSLKISKPSAKGTRYVVDAHRFLQINDLIPEKRVACEAKWAEANGIGAVFFEVPEFSDESEE